MKLFYLTKSDRRTIILLLCIIATALGVIYLTDSRQETATLEEASVKKVDKSSQHIYYYQGEPRQAELFPFDPNTADSTQLLRLGLQPWQVRNIYKYRAAGGVYRKPRDFARLYGLTLKQYRRLEPYIRIKEEDMPADNYFYAYEPIEERDTVRYPIKIQSDERIVLNRADTTTLRKVPGIGSHFARKIVEYRRRLGGFYRVQQLLEIEDFPETAIAFFIIPDSTQPKPCINVNRLSLNELKRHPYINFYQARDIVNLRNRGVRFSSIDDLRAVPSMADSTLERLLPYLSFE